MLTPLAGSSSVVTLHTAGAVGTQAIAVRRGVIVPFAAVGLSTFTVTRPVNMTILGVAAGGFGASNDGGGNGYAGAGAGAGAYTLGTPVRLMPGKTYTVVVPGAATAPGQQGGTLTVIDTTDGITNVSLQGGFGGPGAITAPGGPGGSAAASIGANLFTGAPGGHSGDEAAGSDTATPGGADANSAGGGGGGMSADHGSEAKPGGNGRSEAGHPTEIFNVGEGTTNGGRGGGWLIGGVLCGAGGGGRTGSTGTGTWTTGTGLQGGCYLQF